MAAFAVSFQFPFAVWFQFESNFGNGINIITVIAGLVSCGINQMKFNSITELNLIEFDGMNAAWMKQPANVLRMGYSLPNGINQTSSNSFIWFSFHNSYYYNSMLISKIITNEILASCMN